MWQVGWVCINEVLHQASAADDHGLDHWVPFISTWSKIAMLLQAFSNATTGMQDINLPLHFADNISSNVGFHLVQACVWQQYKCNNTITLKIHSRKGT